MKVKKIILMICGMILMNGNLTLGQVNEGKISKSTALVKTKDIPDEGEIIVNKEGYKFTEVLFIPWGDGENEITIGTRGEYRYGPQSFIVDKKRNIYFGDPGKERTIKYTKKGELTFLNIGGEDGCYITGVFDNGDIFDTRGFVYDSEGEFIYKFHVPSTEASNRKIIQGKDEIFIYSGNRGYNTLIITDKKDKWSYKLAHYKETKKGEYHKQNKGYPSMFFNRDYLVSKSTRGIEISYLEKNGKEVKKTNVLIKKEKKISKYQVGSNPMIIGEDKYGNIYCLVGLGIPSPYYPKKGFSAIQKYNKKGEVMVTLRAFSNWDKIDMRLETPIVVGSEGNIYQLYSQKDGIRVVKWSR